MKLTERCPYCEGDAETSYAPTGKCPKCDGVGFVDLREDDWRRVLVEILDSLIGSRMGTVVDDKPASEGVRQVFPERLQSDLSRDAHIDASRAPDVTRSG